MSNQGLTIKATNYTPGTMSWTDGLKGIRGDVGFFMVADWSKAQSIIETLISQGKPIQRVTMGLDGDWEINSMTVWEQEVIFQGSAITISVKQGEFTPYVLHKQSLWAEPIILVEYADDTSEAYPVWYRGEDSPYKK